MKATRFERARLVRARALQIASGAPSLFTGGEEGRGDPLHVALQEWEAGALPLSVRRAA